jgi:hypothetical protein
MNGAAATTFYSSFCIHHSAFDLSTDPPVTHDIHFLAPVDAAADAYGAFDFEDRRRRWRGV